MEYPEPASRSAPCGSWSTSFEEVSRAFQRPELSCEPVQHLRNRTAMRVFTSCEYQSLRRHSMTMNSFHASPSLDRSPRQVKWVGEMSEYVARVSACVATGSLKL